MFFWICLLLLLIQLFIISWIIKIELILDKILGPNRSFTRFLRQYIGEEILVKTDAGDVSGHLTKVTQDAIQLVESTGDILIIPTENINGVIKE